MSDFIVTKAVQGCTTPYNIWILVNEDGSHNGDWVLEWFEDCTHEKSISLWDGKDYLNDVCLKGTRAKKKFKMFVEDNYPDANVKEVYKEFKKMWKYKNKL